MRGPGLATGCRSALGAVAIAALWAGLAPGVAHSAQAQPDLRVKRVSDPPGSVQPGDRFAAESNVKNVGDAAIGATKGRYYLSLNGSKGGSDIKLDGSPRAPGLDAGESAEKSSTVEIPADAPAGSYLLVSCADDPSRRREADEKNNCRASADRTSLAPNQIVPPVVSIVASPTTVNTNEGSTAQFSVHLTAQPASSVNVNVASGDTGAATVTPSTLTFTPANFATDQQVTVTGVQDADAENESTLVVLSSPGITDVNVTIGVADDDQQAIVASPTIVNTNEGSTAQFSVHLTAQPASSVNVNVASDDTGAATVTPSTLTFTPANFATDQQVTVTGVQDADVANESATVTLSSPGLANVGVTANVTDDDTQAIVAAPTTVNPTEGGTAQFNVHLAFQPASTVTVNVASNDPGAATVSTSSLTFTTANFATDQLVTVTGTADADLTNESTSVTLSSPGLSNVNVTVNVADDDVQGIVVSQTSVSLGEAGNTTFGVQLAFQPASNVNVTVASSDPGAATVSPSTLTFNSANYATNQTVTVSGVNDADMANETVTVTLSSPGATNRTVTANVDDDDDPPPTLSIDDVSVSEGNTGQANATLTVTLSATSIVQVGFDFATADGSASQPIDYVQTSGSKTIAAGSTTTTIDIPVKGDAFAEPNESFTVQLSNPSNATIADGSGQVTITNDD
jgi:hypothetical protein